METNAFQIKAGYPYYHCLLQRYARRIIHDEPAAAAIAAQALQDLQHTEGLVIYKQLRRYIKMDVQHRCHYWKQAQLFNRPPVAVPPGPGKHGLSTDHNNHPADKP